MNRSYELPDPILKNIDLLFISHEHEDHDDQSIKNKVKSYGGLVIDAVDINPMNINGLSILAHYGIHSVPNRIFEVTTVEGYKIVHTGDNETSEALPYIDNVDVLLLYAKTNESFTTYSSVGMRNSIQKLYPTITIPGHIHEFGHEADPRALDNDIRALYKWSFHIMNYWIPTTLQVMAWGEYLDFVK
jgi:L-ascorbate metabolism protein UlaG (beta-lactamase superfamily)